MQRRGVLRRLAWGVWATLALAPYVVAGADGREAVADHVRRHGLGFPQLLDNDYAYWKALGNEYWPALYLVDRCGRIRERAIGEVHTGDAAGRRLEARIEELLAEGPGCGVTRR